MSGNNSNIIERISVLTLHFTSSSPTMASEKQAALAATPPSDADAPTIYGYGGFGAHTIYKNQRVLPLCVGSGSGIFDKIINKEIPSTVVYEDDKVLAFRDITPQAPTHILIIPKVKDGLTGLSQAEERHFEILGRLLYTAKLVAKQEGLDNGFRIVINDGPKGCQSVYHIHVHLLGGRQMNWPPG